MMERVPGFKERNGVTRNRDFTGNNIGIFITV
jgi:hypothetical protein